MAPKRLPTFELSARAHPYIPVSTTTILGNYSRESPPEIPDALLQEQRKSLKEHTETIEQVRQWIKYRDSGRVSKTLRRLFLRRTEAKMPAEHRIHQSINHFFPARAEMQVVVCDFGNGKAEHREVRLGDIEREFQAKPSWSEVKVDSVEALFVHTGSKVMGKPFTRAGRAGWPYLELETFDLRSSKSMQCSRDILRMLQGEQSISDIMDRELFAGDNNVNLKKDVLWRAQYVGQDVDFWTFSKADIPWQISEGSNFNMNGPSEGLRETNLDKTVQSITRHSFFKDAHIARNPFRCFHRNDGFLLTMSPAVGVDYLNTNLPSYLELPGNSLSTENFASATAQVFREFSETRTQTWLSPSVEWFLVYLITEVGATPHNIRQGYSVPSLMDAYDSIVHELKERRYDQWQRNETINLVRAYLICLDELTVLQEIFSKKLDFFHRLSQDCEDFLELQATSDANNLAGETPAGRIAFAEHFMSQSSAQCIQLIADLRESFDTLFQLRSVEQNEITIMADTQNNAIFVFTAITIVFLPLSFFNSYFGMNLQGVVDTKLTQVYFWKVCGSFSIDLVLVISLYAFRQRLQQSLAQFDTGRD